MSPQRRTWRWRTGGHYWRSKRWLLGVWCKWFWHLRCWQRFVINKQPSCRLTCHNGHKSANLSTQPLADQDQGLRYFPNTKQLLCFKFFPGKYLPLLIKLYSRICWWTWTAQRPPASPLQMPRSPCLLILQSSRWIAFTMILNVYFKTFLVLQNHLPDSYQVALIFQFWSKDFSLDNATVSPFFWLDK